MPGRDGLALLNAAQRDHRHVVRLLASAYAEKEVAIAAINEGRVMRILEKPFDEPVRKRGLARSAGDLPPSREREHILIEGRAAAIRETLGFLAHELNTPLATGCSATWKRGEGAASGSRRGRMRRPGRRRGSRSTVRARCCRCSTRPSAARCMRCRWVATFVQSAREAYPAPRGAAARQPPGRRAAGNEVSVEGDERAGGSALRPGRATLPCPRSPTCSTWCCAR